MVECVKKHIITIIAVSLIVIAVVVTVVVLVTRNEDKSSDDKKPEEPLIILLKNEEFKKPNRKINAVLELVKLKNGMKGMIISDPYATKSHFQFSIKHGYFIDTVQGISHFGEHMILQGSEKYGPIYQLPTKVLSIFRGNINAFTSGTFQGYYATLPYNFEYEKIIDMYTDAFRYPLYRADMIKNEIQAVNHEFYDKINHASIEEDIIRQLSKKETSFNGMGCGNNETLKPDESELLSKKLKGYHMVIKNPNNIFFTLYSNKTIEESEQLAKTYLNYEMHNFPDNEIDVEDKKKLEDNIKTVESVEIFDDNLYMHGFYYNSIDEVNILHIFYYLGKVDFQKLKFDIVEYFNYLFNSKSLLEVLRNKTYIAVKDKISVSRTDYLDNNNFFLVTIQLTEEGLNNINDILVIINKYIEIMKNEGYKKEYYINFANYMNTLDILSLNKESIASFNLYLKIFMNHHYFESDQILSSGSFTEENYNEDLLKECLNLIKYEKSFYSVNSMKKISELDFLDSIFEPESKKIVTLKYYNTDFILGKIPNDVKEEIYNKTIIIENLSIRDINPYISEKYGDKVIPCYKEEINTCSEKDEFDYEKEDEYNATKLEESETHITYYQIDKSSESHIVYSYMIFFLDDFELIDQLSIIQRYYLNYKFSEISDSISYNFDSNKMQFYIIFKGFSDNIEKIIKEFIDLIIEEPTQEEFDYSKILAVYGLYENKKIEYREYIIDLLNQFLGASKNSGDIEDIIKVINNADLESFQSFHSNFISSIYEILFKIAGNIDKNLVQNIHNYLKQKIPISSNNNIKLKQTLKDDALFYVYNYYQKSTYNSPENGILVLYEVSPEYKDYFTIFNSCFSLIALKYLRFNKTNAYSPVSNFDGKYFYIMEQGLYKEVDQMQDDINNVLLDILNGKIDFDDFDDVIESYTMQVETVKEKTFENLFEDFINNNELNEIKDNPEIIIPKNFAELVQLVAPVFENPKRVDIIIARKDLSDEDFQKMYERRSQIQNYTLNDNIPIIHTTDIHAMRK